MSRSLPHPGPNGTQIWYVVADDLDHSEMGIASTSPSNLLARGFESSYAYAHIIATVQAAARILAIDYGSRRMGLAVSDPLGITAQGLETMQRRNKRADLAYLERVIRKHEVKEIVVGYPLKMSGEKGPQSERVAEFATELRRQFGLQVHLWDERLTSAEANRLLREAELSIEKRARAVDRMAAVLILQSFLQARSSSK
ncbi:MAG TPA: Holliday junction resolvase RuvX [Candidatus Angelobacter sp.]|nr:Holliday junction resolvase RuvX [Candidatus Angelobacter sp.]